MADETGSAFLSVAILGFVLVAMTALFALPHHAVVNATWYRPGHGCSWVTASGDRINYNKLKNFQIRWVALSPDMFNKHGFKMDDVIEIESEYKELSGIWIVKDKTSPRLKNHIDFLFAQQPKTFGSGKVKMRKKKHNEEVV
ncbi:MAG: hypothetical protein II045_07635, partial [Oscillospiraceae bacterium]|nr:hypothetical protein [Oscillospiraceae bacterium]